jgi:hypothetical protein
MGPLKKIILSTVATLFCLGSLFASYDQGDMVLYIRTKPLKATMPKLMRFAKEIVDNEYFDSRINDISSMFGHPDYEGLSTKEGLTVFVFVDRDCTFAPLFVAKFRKNSPMKEDLAKNEFKMRDIRSWTFMSKDEDALKNLSNVDWMIGIADSKVKNDIEAYPSVKKLVEGMNVDMFRAVFGPKFDKISFLFDTLRNMVDDLQKICFAGNFDGSATTLSLHLKANPTSNIGALLSSVAGGETDLPQCVFPSAPYYSLFISCDQEAYKAFQSRLRHDILRNSSYTELDSLCKGLWAKAKALDEKSNGQCAIYVLSDGEKPSVLGISGGKYGDEDAKLLLDYDRDLTDFVDSILELTPSPKSTDGEILQQYTCGEETVYTKGDAHFCICRGYLIFSDSKILIEKVIDGIYSGKNKIRIGEGNVSQGTINLRQICSDVIEWCGNPSKCNVDSLKPVRMRSELGRNSCTTYVEFDNISIREVGKLITGYEDCMKNEDEALQGGEDGD